MHKIFDINGPARKFVKLLCIYGVRGIQKIITRGDWRKKRKWEWLSLSTHIEVDACASHPPIFLRLDVYICHQT
jgi:hypothetical protein